MVENKTNIMMQTEKITLTKQNTTIDKYNYQAEPFTRSCRIKMPTACTEKESSDYANR